MDNDRKKQLLYEYKNRKPEMGVISIQCTETGESFLGVSKDTKADINSVRCKLDTSWHPNKYLQELWNKYGENNFKFSVIRVLKYDDSTDNHEEKLEKLRDECLREDEKARKLWR